MNNLKLIYKIIGIGYVFLLLSIALFSIDEINAVTLSLYGLCFLMLLGLNVVLANKNPISSIYAIGVFFYYYQVPFINHLSTFEKGVYNIIIKNYVLVEYFFLYAVLIGIHILITYFLVKKTKDINLMLSASAINKKRGKKIVIISIIFAVLFLIYAFKNSGGVVNYFMLNKFESIVYGKILFFTWKEFVIIAMGVYFLSGIKNKIFLLVFIGFVVVELLTAKRLLILFIGFFIYITRVKRVSFKGVFLLLGVLFFVNFTKYTYYPMKSMVTEGNGIESLFWFEWNDFFSDMIFMGEFSGHIRLSYLYLFYDIPVTVETFINQLSSLLPLSSNFNLDYMTAGEELRIFLNEPWSGLASSLYIQPYKTTFLPGLFVMYLLYFLIIKVMLWLYKRSTFFLIVFYINLPIIFLYIQREELIIVSKNLFIIGTALLLILFCNLFLELIRKIFIYEKNSKLSI